MLLWKSADQTDPPENAQNIDDFGWNVNGSIMTPSVSTSPVASLDLLDIISCSCSAPGKACSGTRCSCNSAGLSCTDYCNCERGDTCCSPFTGKQLDTDDNEELDVDAV